MRFSTAILFGLLGYAMAAPTGMCIPMPKHYCLNGRPALLLLTFAKALRRTTSINSGLAEISESDTNPGEMKADYRRDVEVEVEDDPGRMHADYRRDEAGEDPGDMHADYRRDVEIETEEDPGEMKADYRRDIQSETETVEDPGEMKADYRRDVEGDTEVEEDPGDMKADY